MYQFIRLAFIEFSFVCDACGETPLSPQYLFAVAFFAIINYNAFTFAMVTTPFGLTRSLMVLAISSTMIT